MVGTKFELAQKHISFVFQSPTKTKPTQTAQNTPAKIVNKMEKIKSRWTRSFITELNWNQEKHICDVCQKDFSCPSNLALHKNTHLIERPHKCEPCGLNFDTLEHLQKHTRSSAHESRLLMTQAYGVPSKDNPRPYSCDECGVGFRKHGHLSKHLRSKSHNIKLGFEQSSMPTDLRTIHR